MNEKEENITESFTNWTGCVQLINRLPVSSLLILASSISNRFPILCVNHQFETKTGYENWEVINRDFIFLMRSDINANDANKLTESGNNVFNWMKIKSIDGKLKPNSALTPNKDSCDTTSITMNDCCAVDDNILKIKKINYKTIAVDTIHTKSFKPLYEGKVIENKINNCLKNGLPLNQPGVKSFNKGGTPSLCNLIMQPLWDSNGKYTIMLVMFVDSETMIPVENLKNVLKNII